MTTDAGFHERLQHADDELSRELLCVQRRYHGEAAQAPDGGWRLRCFLSLSDPDLPESLRGESDVGVTLPAAYPKEPLRVDLSCWQHRMSRAELAAVNSAAVARAEQLRGTFCVRKVLTWLDNNVWRVLQGVTADATTPPTENEAESKSSRNRRRPRPCRFFAKAMCKNGDECSFAHVRGKDEPVIKTVEEEEEEAAAKEEAAAMAKEVNGRAPSPVAGSKEPRSATKKKTKKKTTKTPQQQNEKRPDASAPENQKKPCKYFASGKCRSGKRCKFLHATDTRALLLSPGKIIIATIGEPVAPPSASTSTASPSAPSSEPAPTLPQAPASPVRVQPTAQRVAVSPLKSSDPNEWTTQQQRALDEALKKYPVTMDKKQRWVSIAEEVDGKSLNDCIDRFKYLCSLVKSGQVMLSSASSSSSPRTTETSKMQEAEKDTESDDDVETEAETEQRGNSKIIPERRRVPIETEPAHRGTQLSLADLFLYQVGTLVMHRLVCQVQCANCPLKFDAALTLDVDSAGVQKWCPRCSVQHVVRLRPVFAHSHSDTIAYADTENCAIVDVLPSDLLATCLDCGTDALVEGVQPTRRSEQACFTCHTKLAVLTKRFALHCVEVGETKGSALTTTSPQATSKKQRRVVDAFVPGQPLPRKGACDHYKHSFRWFRFQCCGKAFPCDVCHDSSDCAEANTGKIASKIICGLCSKEQSSQVKDCSCGNSMGRKTNRTRHWEGGRGCRDQTLMSVNDRQKFRGLHKTESQKHKRVGGAQKSK
ncbi:hypothetical protein ATCC90586_001106 [Pythium insidiosum]|nr:hypothetical protein ATCC90586_001106 [Pythium insidiosum]